jgi:hypothetical protein
MIAIYNGKLRGLVRFGRSTWTKELCNDIHKINALDKQNFSGFINRVFNVFSLG